MKLALIYPGLLLAASLALGASLPAMADDAAPATTTDTTTTTTTTTTPAPEPITVSGKVTEPNFQAKTFWVNTGDKNIAVRVGDADVKYNGQTANVYRMMGTPSATVTGTMMGNLLYATSVTITSGPTARLQQSSYTDQAVPAFGASDLVPLHVGEGTGAAGGGTATTTDTTTGTTATTGTETTTAPTPPTPTDTTTTTTTTTPGGGTGTTTHPRHGTHGTHHGRHTH